MFNISFVLGSLILIVSCFGVRSGIVGIAQRRAARKIRENARKKYENAVALVDRPFRSTLELANKYGQLQLRIKKQTIARFLELVERIGQQIPAGDRAILESLEGFSIDRPQQYAMVLVEPDDFAARRIEALRATHSLDRFAFGAIGFFGVGALDRSTLLAWISGSAFKIDFGFANPFSPVTILPVFTLVFGGFWLQGIGKRSLNEARQYEADIEEHIAKVIAFESFCERVSRQIIELADSVRALNRKAIEGLNELESRIYPSAATLVRSSDMFVGSVSFVVDRDTAKLQEVSLLVKALAEIGGSPVIDADGQIDPGAVRLLEKYGAILK